MKFIKIKIGIIACIFLIVATLGFFAMSDSNINSNEMVIDYSFKDPTIYLEGDITFVEIEGLENSLEPNEPFIPIYYPQILIPFGKKAIGYDLELNNKKLIAKGNPIINSEILPWLDYDEEYTTLIEEDLNQIDEEIEDKLSWSSSSYNGYYIFSTIINPIEYSEGNFYFYKNIKLKIYLEDNELSLDSFDSSTEYRDKISSRVENPEYINSYEVKSKKEIKSLDISLFQNGEEAEAEYLIITNETLKNSSLSFNFTTLLNSKSERNITGIIITTEKIFSNSSFWCDGEWGDDYGKENCSFNNTFLFNDSAAMIRNYIKYAYNELGTKWVLLGGDTNIIPVRVLYASLSRSDGGYKNNYIESDIYYSNLNGSFNENLNEYWGDENEIDRTTHVIVGRFPVQNETELNNIVRKTLLYENLSREDDPSLYFKNTFLLYDPSISDPAILSNSFREFNVKTESWAVSGNNQTMKYFDDNSNNSNLFPQIMNYAGHGAFDYMNGFKNGDPDNMKNYNLPLFINSQTCKSGSFTGGTKDHSFYERMMIVENGSFAIISNTALGWIGPSNVPMKYFWEEINKNNSLSIGEALLIAKNRSIELTGAWKQYYNYLYLTINLMGDPELSLMFNVSNIGNLSLNIHSPSDKQFYNSTNITINITSNTNGGNISILESSKELNNSNYSSFEEGEHNLTVKLNHSSYGTLEKNITFYVDITPPNISDNTNISKVRRGENVTFNFTFKDNSPLEISSEILETNINGSWENYTNIKNYSENYELVFQENFTINTNGSNFSYNFYIKDMAGNIGNYSSKLIEIENTPPIFNDSYKIPPKPLQKNFTIDKSLVFEDIDILYGVDSQKLNISISNSENITIEDLDDKIIISAINNSITSGSITLSANDSINTTEEVLNMSFYGIVLSLSDIENSNNNWRNITLYIEVIGENGTLGNCSAYLNSQKLNDSLKNEDNIFLENLSIGNYNFLLNCSDNRGDNWSINKLFEVTRLNQGNGGGPSKPKIDVAPKENKPGEVELNTESSIPPVKITSEKSNLNIRKGNQIKININDEEHNILLNDFDEKGANITIFSEPKNIYLKIGEEVFIDLDNNGIYDLLLELKEIRESETTISVKEISINDEKFLTKEIHPKKLNLFNFSIMRQDGKISKFSLVLIILLSILFILIIYASYRFYTLHKFYNGIDIKKIIKR